MDAFVERVKIGPCTYEVEFVEHLEAPDRAALNGHIKYDVCRILIEATVSPQVQRATLIHEIVHGVASVAGVEMEEEEVERFAAILTTVLVDNPGLAIMWRGY